MTMASNMVITSHIGLGLIPVIRPIHFFNRQLGWRQLVVRGGVETTPHFKDLRSIATEN